MKIESRAYRVAIRLNTRGEGLIGGPLTEEVHHFEARLILGALERANGRITLAARELKISHQGLEDIPNGRQSSLRRSSTTKKKSATARAKFDVSSDVCFS